MPRRPSESSQGHRPSSSDVRGPRRSPADDPTPPPPEADRSPREADPPDESWTPEEDLGEPEIAEAVGDTVEEAIEHALDILGAREDEVEIQVLDTGHRGFLGFGKRRPFRVRVTWIEDADEETIEEDSTEDELTTTPAPAAALPPRRDAPHAPVAEPPIAAPPPVPAAVLPRPEPSPTPAEPPSTPLAADLGELARRARDVTDDLLRRMGMTATITATSRPDEIDIAVESDEDDALLIGRRGETRAALEHLIQRLAIPREGRDILVHLDVNGYWQRRVERLRSEACELAEQAVRDRQEIRTEPLSAQERRVIHRALVDDERVSTESIGTGALKRVAIIPASDR